jgi:hypothetical protein
MNEVQTNQPIHGSERFQPEVQRRDFLGLAALWSFLSTGVVMLAGALRLPMPSIFPESGSKFRIGPPDRFPPGSSTRLAERNVLVTRDERGFRAASPVTRPPASSCAPATARASMPRAG